MNQDGGVGMSRDVSNRRPQRSQWTWQNGPEGEEGRRAKVRERRRRGQGQKKAKGEEHNRQRRGPEKTGEGREFWA